MRTRGSGLRAIGLFLLILFQSPQLAAEAWTPIPHPQNPESKLTLVIYGDNLSGLGHPVVHQTLLKQMVSENPALVLHTGNMVASGGRVEHWKQFLNEGEAFFSAVPLQPVPGGHDFSRRNHFSRYLKAQKKGKTYYTFVDGPARFIALDTTRNFSSGSRQYRFLLETLQAADQSMPLIVYFHHPAFSGSLKGGDEKVQKELVPLFEKYGVDLVLSGQERAYQRIGPVNGVVYVVSGGGGGPLFPVQPDPSIVKYRTLYHYLVLEVQGGSIRGRMKDPRGIEEDYFEILTNSNPIPSEQVQAHPKLKKSQRYSIQ